MTNRPVSGLKLYEPAQEKGLLHVASDIFWNGIGAGVGLFGKDAGANPFIVSGGVQGSLTPVKIKAKEATGPGSKIKDYDPRF